MRKFTTAFLILALALGISACGNTPKSETPISENNVSESRTEQTETSLSTDTKETSKMTTIQIIINGQEFEAELYDNEAAQQFREMLPLQLDMDDLHDNEKFFYFSDSFNTADQEMKEIHEGDLLIYDSKCLVLFYENLETRYKYTPLGKISDTAGLKEALGAGTVSVSFNINDMTDTAQTSVNDVSFNFETKTVTLNSGYEMPIYGIGTYSLLDEECVNSVQAALENGVRLIDTAYMYHNEESVGEAVRNSGIPREEIFVITKLYPNQFANAEAAIDEALEKLDIEYIDLMLLHHPGNNDVDAYHAMEAAVSEGKIRSIGLSNWYVEELEEFLPQVTITPALVQNEIHPYYQENDVIPYIQSLGIVVQGWYPLGGRGHTAELLNNEVISEIASSHGKSSAQVILRWNLQKGVVVIPGSSNPEHIKENTELFDFELTDKEMDLIKSLDRNEKHDWY
ncbi:MAG: aldo/keto reductase [Lachnospiraceae bacterium]|nr:aldo/keto reductase [Lachnospiraceae bacterium]